MDKINLISLAQAVEKIAENYPYDIKLAVMGCAVNGPGEAREADFGVACGKGKGVIFSKGEPVKTVAEKDIITELVDICRKAD